MRHRAPTPGLALLAVGAAAVLTLTALIYPSSGSSFLDSHSVRSDAGIVPQDYSSFSGPSLSNGVVRVSFHGPNPVFTLSSVSDSRVATIPALYGIAEVSPNGSLKAFASLTSFSSAWTFLFLNSTTTTSVLLTSSLPVYSSQSLWNESEDVGSVLGGALGTVNVSVGFSLNVSSRLSPASVHVWVNATHWPWSNTNDSLGLELGLRASQSTRIEYGDTEYKLVESKNETGSHVATFVWGRTATVVYGNGAPATSATGSFRSVAADESNSTVRLVFFGVAGGYSSISYDPYIVLNLSSFAILRLPAWAITPMDLAALAAGGAVSGLLAVVALRRRAAPSEPM